MNNLIYSQALVAGNKKGKLISIGLLAVALVIVGIAATVFIIQEVNAPLVTSNQQIDELKIDQIVKVETDLIFFNGFYEPDSKNNAIAWYYFVDLSGNGNYILVRSKKDLTEIESGSMPVTVFKGAFRNDPYRKDHLKKFVEMGGADDTTEAEKFLYPYEISDKYSRDYLYILIFAGAFFAWAAYIFYKLGKNKKNRLFLEGITDVDAADASFSEESESGDTVVMGKLTLTKNWLFNSTYINVFLFPKTEIVWAYKTITTHSYNGIPTGKTSAITFCLSDGKVEMIPGKEPVIDAALDFIHSYWPRTYLGFTEEMKAHWKKDFNDFVAGWRNQANQD